MPEKMSGYKIFDLNNRRVFDNADEFWDSLKEKREMKLIRLERSNSNFSRLEAQQIKDLIWDIRSDNTYTSSIECRENIIVKHSPECYVTSFLSNVLTTAVKMILLDDVSDVGYRCFRGNDVEIYEFYTPEQLVDVAKQDIKDLQKKYDEKFPSPDLWTTEIEEFNPELKVAFCEGNNMISIINSGKLRHYLHWQYYPGFNNPDIEDFKKKISEK